MSADLVMSECYANATVFVVLAEISFFLGVAVVALIVFLANHADTRAKIKARCEKITEELG